MMPSDADPALPAGPAEDPFATVSRHPGGFERVRRWAGRRRRALAAVAAVALLACVALAWGAWEQRRSRERIDRLLVPVIGQVRGLEDSFLRVPLTEDARRAAAEQPLDLIQALLAEHPDAGAAIAWRGRVLELLDRSGEAEQDFDRACAGSPDDPTVWYLRGSSRLTAFARARGLPDMVSDVGGAQFVWTRETEEQAALRGRALADLEAMRRAARTRRRTASGG